MFIPSPSMQLIYIYVCALWELLDLHWDKFTIFGETALNNYYVRIWSYCRTFYVTITVIPAIASEVVLSLQCTAAPVGIPNWVIKILERWTSNNFQVYICSSSAMLQWVSALLAHGNIPDMVIQQLLTNNWYFSYAYGMFRVLTVLLFFMLLVLLLEMLDMCSMYL